MNDSRITRRQFAAGLAAFGWAALGGRLAGADRIESIEPHGLLVGECSLEGERRGDDVVPAQPGGIQVSRDRWLLLYATRGFRGVDDDRSIVWQLRQGSFMGRVVKEGFLARSFEDYKPASNSPLTVFTGPDGVVRLFTGDPTLSPHRNGRDPLYGWEVNPTDFSCSSRRVIFDSVQAKLPIRAAAVPKIDMAKLLPHQGRTQLIAYRVSVRSYLFPYVGSSGKPTGIPPINKEELAACGIYCAKITYKDELPPAWEFAR
jgi:hypothetical protein